MLPTFVFFIGTTIFQQTNHSFSGFEAAKDIISGGNITPDKVIKIIGMIVEIVGTTAIVASSVMSFLKKRKIEREKIENKLKFEITGTNYEDREQDVRYMHKREEVRNRMAKEK